MLQDKPYNKDDDVIKATSFEVISTLRDVLKTSSLWRDHVQTYTQVWPFSQNFRFNVLLHAYISYPACMPIYLSMAHMARGWAGND